MRYFFFISICSVFIVFGCATSKKSTKDAREQESTISRTLAPATPIPVKEVKEVKEDSEVREVEERLVPIEEKAPDPSRYFVIIGSFRDRDNAGKYQNQIISEGFKSEILRNESGLYRISVMATDDLDKARDEIQRIRKEFPKYYDTWLLIQKF